MNILRTLSLSLVAIVAVSTVSTPAGCLLVTPKSLIPSWLSLKIKEEWTLWVVLFKKEAKPKAINIQAPMQPSIQTPVEEIQPKQAVGLTQSQKAFARERLKRFSHAFTPKQRAEIAMASGKMKARL